MSEIDLYRIVMDEQVWTMTSADERQTYNGEYYRPVAMGRTGTEQKNSLARANLDVRLPLNHALSQSLMTSLYDQVVTLTLFINDDGDISTAWKGRLATIQPEKTHLTISFESIFTSLRRPGLRARFQKSCRHALYYRGCNLNMEDFASAATVSAINGSTLTVPEAAGQSDGYWLGGMVAAANGALAFVTAHTGDQVTVQRVPYPLIEQLAQDGAGTAITLYPGCDHSRATCKAKFNNLLNYGGFDWIPQKNPMGGSSIV